eukprot:15974-Heterococcus_DN1.PRE.1
MSQVESVSLAGRTKEPYSMWRKMLRQRSDAAGVLDAVALRVVLKAKRLPGDTDAAFTARSEALCYEAMRIVGDLYATMQSRSKDYISCAKPNGYQSLHATCLMVPEVGGPAQPFEVQVRTFEMHQHAEFGVAAHWSYKGEGAPAFSTSSATADAASSVSKPSAAVRPTVGYSVPASIVDGKEFVNWLHTELQSRKVFVFGPDGSIWDLDKASATAADIMRLVSISNFYSNVRGPTPSLLVAGKQVPADHMLRNGDTISLVVEQRAVRRGHNNRQTAAAAVVVESHTHRTRRVERHSSTTKQPQHTFLRESARPVSFCFRHTHTATAAATM